MRIGEVVREVEVLPIEQPTTLPAPEPSQTPATAPTEPRTPTGPVPA